MVIQNFSSLASTPARKMALEIASAGLEAINTEKVIKDAISLQNTTLTIQDKTFDLKKFQKIYVFGIGKASADATITLYDLLKERITQAIAIDIKEIPNTPPTVKIIKGTHPKPSPTNVAATREILKIAETLTEEDLVICIISGGGSALFCASENEYEWGATIYEEFLKTGGTINELNALRKHISPIKGGGFAKVLYPATVVSLIFSDVPGGQNEDVASGPTYKDPLSLEEVKKVIDQYHLEFPSQIQFTETPKEEKYFEKVTNILLVSNQTALKAMTEKAQSLGLHTTVVSASLMDDTKTVARKLASDLTINQCLIAGGEPRLTVGDHHGKGGRNQHLTLESLPYLNTGQVFISLGSDGVDNTEDADGAIADDQTLEKAQVKNLDAKKYEADFNAYEFFDALGDLIKTGPTGSNVADLMISLRI